MISFKPVHAVIAGVGSYAPEKVMTNHDMEQIVETSDEWIRTRTGIKERHIASDDQASSDLAYKAAQEALKDAEMAPEEIQLIIVATVTPDMLFPSTACFVQKKLGAVRAAAFDLSAACTGFVYALGVAASLIESGQYQNVLVIGAEALSKFVDWEDRGTCILFGDGAGATVLKASDEDKGILKTHLFSEAEHTDLLYLPGGGSAFPLTPKTLKERLHFIKMKGNEVFKIAVNTMVDAAQKILKDAGLNPEDVACVIPHQANVRIINAVRKRLLIDEERVYINVDRFGNTSAATIPIALDELVKSGKVGSGDLILMVAFGGGFTSGSLLLKL
jgi:3-oxoacyl-[acyl-carrier-protein] synthase-3